MSGNSNLGSAAGSKPIKALFGYGLCVVCIAVFVSTILLFLSILFVTLKVPLGIEPVTLGGLFLRIYHAVLVPVFTLLGDILRSFSPWGFIALGAVLLVFRGPDWIREALVNARLKWGDFEFDGSAASSRFRRELSEAARIVERANKEISEAYDASTSFACVLREQYRISIITSEVARQIAGIFGASCPSDYKMTLYIPDLVFDDRIYQFTEYYDAKGSVVSDRRAGRAYSIRYGIIGRVWRSGVAEIEGQLLSKPERDLLVSDPSQGPVDKFIARRWGLTLAEAVSVREYNSYGAIRLDFAEAKVGEIFFYSKDISAFGDEQSQPVILKKIEEVLDRSELKSQLFKMSQHVAPWSGKIRVFKNS